MRTPAVARATKTPGVRRLGGGEEPVVGEDLLAVSEDVVDESLREVCLLGSRHLASTRVRRPDAFGPRCFMRVSFRHDLIGP